MKNDRIDQLIEEAHAIFSATSVYEIIDMPADESPEDFLNKIYNKPGSETISKYLSVVEKIRSQN